MTFLIDFIDLIEFCKRHTNKLSKVRVYGKITNKISEPKSIRSDVTLDTGSICCNMELIAVRLSEYKGDLELLGLSSKDDIYFVNGSISVIVDETITMNDWYAIDGTLRLSTLSRRAPIMGLFDFYKMDTEWAIHPTQVFDLPIEDFTSERVLNYIYQSDEIGRIVLPDEVSSLDKFFSDVPDVIDMQIKQDVLNGFTESWRDTNSADELTTVLSGDTNFTFNNHNELKLGERYKQIETSLNRALSSGSDFYDNIIKEFSVDAHSVSLVYMFRAIIKNLARGSGTSLSGRQLIKRYLISCGASLDNEYLGMPIWNFISNSLPEILDALLTNKEFVATGLGAEYIGTYFADAEKLYAGLVAEIMGVPCQKLMTVAEQLKEQGISFSRVVYSNPYLLFFICDTISIETIEYLANCFGVMSSTALSVMNMTVQEFRCIAVVQNYLRKGIYSNSYVSKKDLLSRLIGSYITSSNYETIKKTGTYLCNFTLNNVCAYFKEGTVAQDLQYSEETHWAVVPSGYLRALSKMELETAVTNALNLGLLLEFQDSDDLYIADMERTYDEFSLYQCINTVSSTECMLSDTTIDSYVVEYESSRGINLTSNQRSAIHLLNKRVFAIDGLVGTGKDTVLDCIEHILKRVEPDVSILRQSLAGESFLSYAQSDADYTLILSDMELCTLDAVMNSIRSLSNVSRIIFVGDSAAVFAQTKGALFRDILNIVPSQSLCDYESDNIIEVNSRALITGAQFQSASNFMFIPCEDDAISITSYLTCKEIISGLSAEELSLLPSEYVHDLASLSGTHRSRDIQVISPIDKATYSWGCYNMNNMLRSAFNTMNSKVFVWGGKDKRVNFKFGDRVMHIKSSMSDICYRKTEDGNYVPDKEIKLPIGAIGTIVGVFDSHSCIFDRGMVNKDCTNYADISFVGAGRFFVAVRYKDAKTGLLFFMLYHAYADTDSSLDCLSLVGGDSDCIKLHYCSTPFRTAGNTSKVVVSLLGEVSKDGYVNRNMLYATWRQAKDLLCVVGNMTALSKARDVSAYTYSKTLGGYLCTC